MTMDTKTLELIEAQIKEAIEKDYATFGRVDAYAKIARQVIENHFAAERGNDDSAQATIEGGCVVIRLPIANIPMAVKHSKIVQNIEPSIAVTDAALFAKDLCNALNDEDEEGSTMIHFMFDEAFDKAINSGAEGWEELPPAPAQAAGEE